MKFTAIICEFNPLTKGHEYLIKEAKKQTNNPILCLMSGNFVQRGEPAISDKYTRAKHAIMCGADLVIELPTIYATASAPDFAYGAIKTLNAIPDVEYVFFGSECGDIEELKQQLNNNSPKIKENLKHGISYATSTLKSLGSFAKSNNILGLEYLKALQQTKSNIVPLTIKREDNFNSIEESDFASATALRKLIIDENYSRLKQLSPANTTLNSYTDYNKFKLLVEQNIKCISSETLSLIRGVSEGLEHRILDAFYKFNNYNDAIDNIKTKRYPTNKIKRIVLNSLLNITGELVELYKNNNESIYLKVLAVNQNNNLLNLLPKSLLVTTKKSYNNLNQFQSSVINIDLLASKIYSCINNNYNCLSDYIYKL